MTADKGIAVESRSAAGLQPLDMTALEHEPIQLTLQTSVPETLRAGILAVAAFPEGPLPESAQSVDKASGGKISRVLERGDLGEKAGATLLLGDLPGVAADRVLLASLGRRDKFGERAFREALAGVAKGLSSGRATDAAVALLDVEVPKRSAEWQAQVASRVLADGAYRFKAPGVTRAGQEVRDHGGRRITLSTSGKVTPELDEAVRRGQAVAEGVALAKDLGNLPGNVCNPAFLADTARALGKELGLRIEVLERADMAKLGMGSALSVGQASDQPCRVIVMQYEGGDPKAKPVVLVGKGITFDTGGISLKPGTNMDEMKFDMCGAASVFGALKTAARLKLPINIVGLVHAAENMPGGNASRPGDVVTSMSGQTIEILNTDAEGRLGLCDVLTYAERFDPACVVDIATLTGACVIALGSVASGLMANDDALADELLECGIVSGDRAWQLPLLDEYQDQLKSNFADMSNIGGRAAGAITAGCFLARFATNYKWAHFDIAGTNAISGDDKGATGRPVPLLSEFLINRAH